MKIRLLTASLMTAIAALPSAAQCIGDTNEDGTVNTHDLLLHSRLDRAIHPAHAISMIRVRWTSLTSCR